MPLAAIHPGLPHLLPFSRVSSYRISAQRKPRHKLAISWNYGPGFSTNKTRPFLKKCLWFRGGRFWLVSLDPDHFYIHSTGYIARVVYKLVTGDTIHPVL